MCAHTNIDMTPTFCFGRWERHVLPSGVTTTTSSWAKQVRGGDARMWFAGLIWLWIGGIMDLLNRLSPSDVHRFSFANCVDWRTQFANHQGSSTYSQTEAPFWTLVWTLGIAVATGVSRWTCSFGLRALWASGQLWGGPDQERWVHKKIHLKSSISQFYIVLQLSFQQLIL